MQLKHKLKTYSPLFLYVVLSVFFYIFYASSIINKSATYDEPIIIASGNHFLTSNDNRINSENPPFLKSLLALPTLLINPTKPDINDKVIYEYGTEHSFEFGNSFLFNNNFTAILFYSRCINILLTIALGLFIVSFLKLFTKNKIYHYLAFILFMLSPNIIAHGRLATLDIGVSLFMFATNYFLIKYFITKNKINIIFTGIFLSLSLLSKFTAILLIPCIIIEIIIYFAFIPKNNKLRNITALLLSILVIPVIIIICFYAGEGLNLLLFNRDFVSSNANLIFSNIITKNIPIPLPYTYLKGFDIVSSLNSAGDEFTFLGGTYQTGIWCYYIIIFILKVPIPTILLSCIGFYLISRKYKKNKLFYIILTLPLIVLFCFSFCCNRQLGIRYILPVFPYIILLAVYTIKKAIDSKSRIYILPVGLALFFQIVSVGISYPNYISYFNEIVGGSSNAYKYFEDSNLDWGQDLPGLKQWLEKHSNSRAYISYFGQTPLKHYNIESTTENPDYIIVSASKLHALKKYSKMYRKLFFSKPFDKINNSILVYKIETIRENKQLPAPRHSKPDTNKKTVAPTAKIIPVNNISRDNRYYIEVKQET